MKEKLYITFLILIFSATITAAQKPIIAPAKQDERKINSPINPLIVSNDTLSLKKDTIIQKVPFSKDGLDEPVEYNAKDSIFFDNENNFVYLYGNASVKYSKMSLKANYIQIDIKNSAATAEGTLDSLKKLVGTPEFDDGSGQSFKANKMLYNFKTKKGKVFDVRTKQGELYVLGRQTKYIADTTKIAPNDTTYRKKDIIYNENAIITSCNDPQPHFGIRSTKQKIIPNKLIVVGPSRLEIMGVPTPIWLPFAAFPITAKKHSGLIFPRGYEYSQQWGFGLKELGYYFPINDYSDLTLKGDIYFNGSWGMQAASNYRQRYKYNGSFLLGYSDRRSDVTNKAVDSTINISRTKSFNIRWSHSQDASAHPYHQFSASVNFQTGSYNQLNRTDFNSKTNNQFSSNISFTQRFPDKPFSLALSANHSQNTNTKIVTMSLPNIDIPNFTFYPFKDPKQIGDEKWYQKIVISYGLSARNQVNVFEKDLFTPKMYNAALAGVQQKASTNINFRVMKYFNLSPFVNYTEQWALKTVKYNYNKTSNVSDTTYNWGFHRWNEFSSGVSLNTQIFGTALWKKGLIRGVRHVIKPSISFGYTPAFAPTWARQDSVFTYDATNKQRVFSRLYSPLDGNPLGTPTYTTQAQMGISYSLINIFEAKFRGKRDTIDKRMKLFDNIYMGGNYNFLADTLKWSTVSMSGTTRLFKDISTLSFNAVFDPYMKYYKSASDGGTRINKFAINEIHRPLRFESATVSLFSNITVTRLKELIFKKKRDIETEEKERQERNDRERANLNATNQQNNLLGNNNLDNNKDKKKLDKGDGDLWDFFEKFSIDHNIGFSAQAKANGKTQFDITMNSLGLRGALQLSPKWAVTVGNIGYDFKNKGATYPDFGFVRDLHCWIMRTTWQPTNGTYNFYIGVKSSVLEFLKAPFAKNYQDGFKGF